MQKDINRQRQAAKDYYAELLAKYNALEPDCTLRLFIDDMTDAILQQVNILMYQRMTGKPPQFGRESAREIVLMGYFNPNPKYRKVLRYV